MNYILNIETATKNCSISLAKDGQTVFCKEIAEQGYSHAEKLHVFIEDILKEAGKSVRDLKAIAISKGPGSYTGLRIGVSAAKGLCYALQIPLISVDTLQVLAQKVTRNDGLIIPMIDARRMEVYSAVFDANHQKIMEVQAEVLTENSYADITETVYFVGDCQEKCQSVLTKDNFVFLPEIIFPSANEMSPISFEKFTKNDFEDVAYFEPFYLKDFMLTKK
ncbi:tRNA (adenosine(37)-N6)-threonylcarbamoyltransferase complex dimerization subunit type 1 TsaB [Flavobacterium buctense]|uniref:tRNA (Adenosine(37)-N6)-threonylcarbamoyltransferase complex dimerization subunit type 1 TsaB n=1 Tax=Flavobacterium buctense TaxID=1648146 RepID=A0ABU9DYG5_9FLAO|nr:tRNA (adenosine(37)-N6)-threonylcarbamoyltransferase complex dimerization subunit type 1 TsaB [Flavobacterium buctense]